MVAPEPLADEHFAHNRLVTGEPKIRFYAGMPIVTGDGYALGTLCVIDRKPRDLTSDQKNRLMALAESTAMLFEMRSSLLGEIFAKAVAATVEGVTIADAPLPEWRRNGPPGIANDQKISWRKANLRGRAVE
jgi:hypothetical protein